MLKHACALLAFVAAVPATAQPLTAAEIAQIDKAVAKALADTSVPSASIAVVRNGKIVLTKAYGKASETLGARPDLPYQIASNSKQFTAMALLLLEDEGKLSLNDTVSRWLSGISGGDKITIRQLLSHTSGIQDFWPQDYSFAAMFRPATPQDIADRWAKNRMQSLWRQKISRSRRTTTPLRCGTKTCTARMASFPEIHRVLRSTRSSNRSANRLRRN